MTPRRRRDAGEVSLSEWEERLLAESGAERRVQAIDDELRRAAGLDAEAAKDSGAGDDPS